MTADGPKKPSEVLFTQHLMRPGVEVKLDKGFAAGTYCAYVEYDDLASRWGFEPARRTAMAYCDLLKERLGEPAGCTVGSTCDESQTEDSRRNHDLESTFLWFAIETHDGQFHDDAMREAFQLAAVRASQAWDQELARQQARRRNTRQERFRQQLTALLDGPNYARMDGPTKERLIADIPALAFPARGPER